MSAQLQRTAFAVNTRNFYDLDFYDLVELSRRDPALWRRLYKHCTEAIAIGKRLQRAIRQPYGCDRDAALADIKKDLLALRAAEDAKLRAVFTTVTA
jgi:hypothetical protein